jgi:putative transposase
MPRQTRLEMPGLPLHVTQRGVNRCAIFLDDADRHHYRRLLRNACRKHGVAVHAFVLMDNHVHLLVGAEQAGCVSRALRQAGQTYVQSFNQRHGRVGTLWQGRFKSSIVDSDAYALHVIRYIELNPVRAAMAEQPEDYRWTSVHTHVGLAHDPLLTPHPAYLALATDRATRAEAYRAWLHAPLDPEELTRIRAYMAQEKALGDPRFQSMLEKALNRPVSVRPRGRPRRATGEGLEVD